MGKNYFNNKLVEITDWSEAFPKNKREGMKGGGRGLCGDWQLDFP